MALGKCSSKILMIAARCMPASTARREPFDQFEAVDLTRRPVTLSSVGPPPAPFQEQISPLREMSRQRKGISALRPRIMQQRRERRTSADKHPRQTWVRSRYAKFRYRYRHESHLSQAQPTAAEPVGTHQYYDLKCRRTR